MRESNFELLRIVCIWGIITMHIYAPFLGIAEGGNLVYGVLINSIFNTGVSLFVLISGYYGIKVSLKKLINLWLIVVFYSIFSWLVLSIIQGNWSIIEFLKSLFPVFTEKYWYITSYMILLLFSYYINRIPEELEQKSFEKLLLLLLIVFSVFPTILHFSIMNDSGKGLANMLLIYLIGRYIKKYCDKEMITAKIRKKMIVVLMLEFILNLIVTLSKGGKGVYAPFAADYSLLIVIASVLIFMMFKSLHIKSKAVNCVAKHVIGIYLAEKAIRAIGGRYIDISIYEDKWYLFLIIAMYAFGVMLICIILDVVRAFVMKYIENDIFRFVSYVYQATWQRIFVDR